MSLNAWLYFEITLKWDPDQRFLEVAMSGYHNKLRQRHTYINMYILRVHM